MTAASPPREAVTPSAPGAAEEGVRRPRAAALRALLVPAASLLAIAAGFAWRALVPGADAARLWLMALVLTGAPVVWRTARDAFRGRFATDLVATLAIVAAVLLAQPLAGLVVVLMQTGGEALERYAERRASDAIRALEAAAPRLAHRWRDGRLEDVRAEAVRPGELLLVRPGELVPCDAVVVDGTSDVDVSRLTGEPVPVSALPGVALMSGSVNGDGPLTVRATARAAESRYARIVQLVRSAQASKAPLQRVADRYALWFTPVTLAVCAATLALTGEWTRVLAVLVVATPCPLILATPVAILGGIDRAARRQIIVRDGGALERLERVRTAVFDKTGTLTIGRPHVERVLALPGFDEIEVLRLAAALEHRSGHLLARTVVEAAEGAGLRLPSVEEAVESPGRGITGTVAGRTVTVGARPYLAERHALPEACLERVERGDERLRAYVAIDGRLAGAIEYADRLRPEAAALLDRLGALGIRRTMLLSGDHTPNARAVAAAVGIADVWGDLLPEDKTRIVGDLEASGERVLMVGDGTNDAPALSAATVGVALAGHGGGVSAEAADVVILADDLARVADALRIGRRTMRIARQSIRVGLGLSALAMVAAALGHIPPTVGAVLQEGIDVAVILNALRTAGSGESFFTTQST